MSWNRRGGIGICVPTSLRKLDNSSDSDVTSDSSSINITIFNYVIINYRRMDGDDHRHDSFGSASERSTTTTSSSTTTKNSTTKAGKKVRGGGLRRGGVLDAPG